MCGLSLYLLLYSFNHVNYAQCQQKVRKFEFWLSVLHHLCVWLTIRTMLRVRGSREWNSKNIIRICEPVSPRKLFWAHTRTLTHTSFRFWDFRCVPVHCILLLLRSKMRKIPSNFSSIHTKSHLIESNVYYYQLEWTITLFCCWAWNWKPKCISLRRYNIGDFVSDGNSTQLCVRNKSLWCDKGKYRCAIWHQRIRLLLTCYTAHIARTPRSSQETLSDVTNNH